MKIKAYLSKCEEVLIVECNGEQYPFDVDKNPVIQAFNLAKQFLTGNDAYQTDTRFKKGRLVLSVTLTDKIASRVDLGA